MIPTRRQFVASLSAVPVFLQTVSAQQPSTRTAPAQDPVLEQILMDIRERSRAPVRRRCETSKPPLVSSPRTSPLTTIARSRPHCAVARRNSDERL